MFKNSVPPLSKIFLNLSEAIALASISSLFNFKITSSASGVIIVFKTFVTDFNAGSLVLAARLTIKSSNFAEFLISLPSWSEFCLNNDLNFKALSAERVLLLTDFVISLSIIFPDAKNSS